MFRLFALTLFLHTATLLAQGDRHGHIYSVPRYVDIRASETWIDPSVVPEEDMKVIQKEVSQPRTVITPPKKKKKFLYSLEDGIMDRKFAFYIPDIDLHSNPDLKAAVTKAADADRQTSGAQSEEFELPAFMGKIVQRYASWRKNQDGSAPFIALDKIPLHRLFRNKVFQMIAHIFGDASARDVAAHFGFDRTKDLAALDKEFAKDARYKKDQIPFEDLCNVIWNSIRLRNKEQIFFYDDVMTSFFEFTAINRKDIDAYLALETVRRNHLEYLLAKNQRQLLGIFELTFEGHRIQDQTALNMTPTDRALYEYAGGVFPLIQTQHNFLSEQRFFTLSVSPTLHGDWLYALLHKSLFRGHRIELLYSYPRSQLIEDSEEAFAKRLEILSDGIKNGLYAGVDLTGSVREGNFKEIDPQITRRIVSRLNSIASVLRDASDPNDGQDLLPIFKIHAYEQTQEGSFYEALREFLRGYEPDSKHPITIRIAHIAALQDADIEFFTEQAQRLKHSVLFVFDANIASNAVVQGSAIADLCVTITKLLRAGHLVTLGTDGGGIIGESSRFYETMEKLLQAGLDPKLALTLLFININELGKRESFLAGRYSREHVAKFVDHYLGDFKKNSRRAFFFKLHTSNGGKAMAKLLMRIHRKMKLPLPFFTWLGVQCLGVDWFLRQQREEIDF